MVRAGIDYLLATQQPDGGWHEDHFTGTGFPKVFYLKYHMYALYFPLMAVARYAAALEETAPVHKNGKVTNHAVVQTERRVSSTGY